MAERAMFKPLVQILTQNIHRQRKVDCKIKYCTCCFFPSVSLGSDSQGEEGGKRWHEEMVKAEARRLFCGHCSRIVRSCSLLSGAVGALLVMRRDSGKWSDQWSDYDPWTTA